MNVENILLNAKNEYNSYDDLLASTASVIIFGAGSAGIAAKRICERYQVKVQAFCDNDARKHGKFIENIRIISVDELESFDDKPRILISSDWTHDIALQLREYAGQVCDLTFCWDYDRWKGHLNKEIIFNCMEKIEAAYDLFADDLSKKTFLQMLLYRVSFNSSHVEPAPYESYFHPRVRPEPGDIIIDGGSWEGDTILFFAANTGKNCEIHAFEPTEETFSTLTKNIQDADLCDIVYANELALHKIRGTMHLNTNVSKPSQNTISSEGDVKISVISLDEYCREKKIEPDLIKMDIEGAELDAVEGAVETIKKSVPKLQICTYHRPSDLWEIPLRIHELIPSYELYLGSHSQYLLETVLYAR